MLSTLLSLGVITLTLCDTLFIVGTVASVNATELVSAGGETVGNVAFLVTRKATFPWHMPNALLHTNF